MTEKNAARGRANRQKGKRGEREVVKLLQEAFPLLRIRRGWQSREGNDQCDVEGLPFWIEVKRRQRMTDGVIKKALQQAATDTDGRPIAVLYRGDREPWSVAYAGWEGGWDSRDMRHFIMDCAFLMAATVYKKATVPNADRTPACFKTDAFKKLNAKWKRKLKNSGFEDLEYEDYTTGEPLSILTRHSSADMRRLYRSDKERYYQLAGQFYWHMKERRKLYEYQARKRNISHLLSVWRRHADGLSSREIAEALPLTQSQVTTRVAKTRQMLFEWLRSGDSPKRQTPTETTE